MNFTNQIKKVEIPWAFMGVQLCIKLLAIWRLGPQYYGDTIGYYGYATQIAASSDWLHGLDFSKEYMPISALRMPGYPLLMDLFQIFSPVYWDVWLVLVQSLMTVLVSGLFLMFLLRWGVNGWLALVAAFWQAFCVRPEVDLSMLTDSLFNNFFLLVVLGLAWPEKSTKNPLPKVLALGCVYAMALLVREVAFYFLPLVAAGCFLDGCKKTALKKMALFLLPPLLVVGGVREWNRYRTGTPFLTLGGTTAFMAPMVLGGAEPFDENTLLDKTIRANTEKQGFSAALGALSDLHEKHGLTVLQISTLVSRKYRTSLHKHPTAHGRYVVKNLGESALLLLNPVFGVRSVADKDPMGRLGSLKPWLNNSYTFWEMGVYFLGYIPFLLLSVAFLAFFLGMGVLWGCSTLLRTRGKNTPFFRQDLSGGGPPSRALAGVMLWWSPLTFGVLFFYSLINIEVRYLGAVSPLAIGGVALLLSALWPKYFSSAAKNG